MDIRWALLSLSLPSTNEASMDCDRLTIIRENLIFTVDKTSEIRSSCNNRSWCHEFLSKCAVIGIKKTQKTKDRTFTHNMH